MDMKKNNLKKNKKQADMTKSIEKLKAFGLKNASNNEGFEIDGEKVTGGKKGTTVDTHWPTTSNIR